MQQRRLRERLAGRARLPRAGRDLLRAGRPGGRTLLRIFAAALELPDPSHLDARAWGGQTDAAYGPVTVRDHIAAKLAGSRQGRINVSAVREAARVLAAQG